MERLLGAFLKGIWIGGTLTVPGVSGGSMAMILGIYEQLISSVNILIGRSDEKKKAAKFLALFTGGALIGIMALSGAVVWALERFPSPVLFFFAGIVAGGLPLILSEIKSSSFRWYHSINLILGILIVVALSYLPSDLFSLGYGRGLGGVTVQFFGGMIAALALVLPGISVSHMLYILGVYKSIMSAISSFELLKLLPFVLGIFSGIILVSKAVEMFMNRYRGGSYMLIFGFVLGSVFELLNDVNVQNVSIWCLLLFFVGFLGMFLFFNKKKADA